MDQEESKKSGIEKHEYELVEPLLRLYKSTLEKLAREYDSGIIDFKSYGSKAISLEHFVTDCVRDKMLRETLLADFDKIKGNKIKSPLRELLDNLEAL